MAHPKADLVSTTDNTDTAPVQKEGGTAIGITDASTVTTGSPITKTFNLRDNANEGAVKRSRVVAIDGGTQATPVGVTGVQTAKGSGTIAFDPGVAGHTIENGNGWIIRGWANYINNVSNTAIYFQSSDDGTRKALNTTFRQHGAATATAIRARYWNPVGISGERGNWSTYPSAANEVYRDSSGGGALSALAEYPTLAIPGELVYLETGKTPTQADYPAKNG